MKIKSIIFLILFLSTMVFRTEKSQSQIWQQSGGPLGGVTSDMIALNQIFIATILGIYANITTGGNWNNMGGLEYYLNSLLETGINNLFAGTTGHGIQKSTNGGQTWSTTGFGNSTCTYLGTPDNTKIYAVIQGGMGIVVTSDAGQTWNPSNNGLTNLNVTDIDWNGGWGFASTMGGGVFKTTNGGQQWTPVNNNLSNLNIDAIDWEFADAFLWAFGIGGGTYVSTNEGITWESEPIPELIEIHGDAITGADIDEIMDNQITVHCVFAGSNGFGIFLTTNNGVNWTACNNGLQNGYVRKIKVDTLNHIVYACTNGGVFKSTNYGTSWVEFNDNLKLTNMISFLVNGNNIFAGTAESGIFLSTNEGVSWIAKNNGLNDFSIHALASNANYLFAGTYSKGVYVSSNSGTSWSKADTGLTAYNISSFAVIGANIFAGVNNFNNGGVFKSSNNGANWTAMNTGITRKEVQALFTSGGNIFAGTFAGGVFLSTNNGSNWTAVNSGLPVPNPTVYCFAQNGNNVYAGTPNGVYVTSNNGTNWQAINTGQEGLVITSILISGNKIIDASGNGVMMSADNGSSWINVSSGLSNTYTITLGSDNNYVFVGSYASSIWRTTPAQLIGIQNISSDVPKDFNLSQNYPNPFNPTTKIRFDVPAGIHNGLVTIKVYDINGRELETIVNQQLVPGTYETEWNAAKYSSGVYIYRLEAIDYSESRKMILLK